MSNGSILIVDDEPSVLDVSRDLLEAAGYEVTCTSSWAGITPTTLGSVDLVLLDVMMPSLNGRDLAAILLPYLRPEARVALFSAMPEDQLQQVARQSGVSHWICKSDAAGRKLIEHVERVLQAPQDQG